METHINFLTWELSSQGPSASHSFAHLAFRRAPGVRYDILRGERTLMDKKTSVPDNYFVVRTRFINTAVVCEYRAPFTIEFKVYRFLLCQVFKGLGASSLQFPNGCRVGLARFMVTEGTVRRVCHSLFNHFRIETGGKSFIVPVEVVRSICDKEGVVIWRR